MTPGSLFRQPKPSAGRGNCLSFSSMFVAMAREADLTAYFQEVYIPPNWRTVNDHAGQQTRECRC